MLLLRVKKESRGKSYDRDYQTELGGPVTVAERKEPASGMVVVKEFSRANAENRLSMLRQVLDSYFISCIEIFYFEDMLYVISEHMTMSLLSSRESRCSDHRPGEWIIPLNNSANAQERRFSVESTSLNPITWSMAT